MKNGGETGVSGYNRQHIQHTLWPGAGQQVVAVDGQDFVLVLLQHHDAARLRRVGGNHDESVADQTDERVRHDFFCLKCIEKRLISYFAGQEEEEPNPLFD